MYDIILDTLKDGIRLLPFLFVTYIVMEYIEHKMSAGTRRVVQASGRFGPLIGSIAGIFPQCGFSAAAASLYAGRVITRGTLIAIFLSTSDEMLPVFISQQVPVKMILSVLGMKVIIGMAAGFLLDLVFSLVKKEPQQEMDIHHMCEHDHCHCEDGIIKSALIHTAQIFSFILLVSFILNLVISGVGEESLTEIILNQPLMGSLLSGIVGLIPNCAASVVITQLYLDGAMSLGAMMSGLLVGAGVGLIVLYRTNDSLKENLKITAILYVIGVAAGMAVDFLGITL
ncbi:putative manganese transporter [Frisingicoccus sp.]|uniref:putative manganese transporter n=1 Tax=Frisingicoccus sp. TaxID=1918627 RepID=UPI003AB247BE